MRITTKGRYSLRALCRLVRNGDSPSSIKVLSKQESISPEFLEQLFFSLKKEGILKSRKGPGGGFSLNVSPEELTIHEIFEAVGEQYYLSPCAIDDESINAKCPRHDFRWDPETGESLVECFGEDFWIASYQIFHSYFVNITLADVLYKRKYDTAKLMFAE